MLVQHGRSFGVAAVAVALAACSAGSRDSAPAVRDSAPVVVARDTRFSVPPAPLSRDTVTVAAGDTGIRVGVDGRLLFPIVFEASCEGEGCQTSFEARACAAVELRARSDAASPVVARLAEGDSVPVRRTDLHIVQPGIVVVKKAIVRKSEPSMDDDQPMPRSDTLRFAAGDTVYLLQYEQLGWWSYWWKGKSIDGAGFWGAVGDGDALGVRASDTSQAVARSQPVIERWWLLGDDTHSMGWWRADSAASLRPLASRVYEGLACPEQR